MKICGKQLHLYGHMAHYPEVDSTRGVVSIRDNLEWRQPRACPQSLEIEQVNGSYYEVLRMGRGNAWRLGGSPWLWYCKAGVSVPKMRREKGDNGTIN